MTPAVEPGVAEPGEGHMAEGAEQSLRRWCGRGSRAEPVGARETE